MDKDEIFKLAQQSGMLSGYEGESFYIIEFANAVAQAERKRCVKLCVKLWNLQQTDALDAAAAIGALND